MGQTGTYPFRFQQAKMWWNLTGKRPGFIPFGAYLTHFGPKSDISDMLRYFTKTLFYHHPYLELWPHYLCWDTKSCRCVDSISGYPTNGLSENIENYLPENPDNTFWEPLKTNSDKKSTWQPCIKVFCSPDNSTWRSIGGDLFGQIKDHLIELAMDPT